MFRVHTSPDGVRRAGGDVLSFQPVVFSKQMQLGTGHPVPVPRLHFKEEASLISLTEVLLFGNCSPVSFSQSPIALRGCSQAPKRECIEGPGHLDF